ncbi:MAG: hypothetical protein CM1200mP35_10570 [Chloroflexota bacterium]|nr:MAG: hypothetical protein CM1200mP35_10570 [Chloroflexota bacterium]
MELTPLKHGLKRYLFRPYFHRIFPFIGILVAGNRSAYSYLPQSVEYSLMRIYYLVSGKESGLVDVRSHLWGLEQ